MLSAVGSLTQPGISWKESLNEELLILVGLCARLWETVFTCCYRKIQGPSYRNDPP